MEIDISKYPAYLKHDLEELINAEKMEKETGETCYHMDCLENELYNSLGAAYREGKIGKDKVTERVKELIEDSQVNNKGVIEYVLGGEKDVSLLHVRVFDEKTKKAVYMKQTKAAEAKGISNCPVCASGNNNKKTYIYRYKEMEADHVTAWSRGGATTEDNCEMLCKLHNAAKGNR